ncbi:hypothetical protein AVEN_132599-1 [Araneus ventricosus]|uniref:Reverse transcriptase zinc-binding domain-containing protein n=1 Tax=Araneus ventricosus TaxID=182803 RepID=A0A4Y2AWL5_ARAVE|nr:hypothetical protein AVEN_132599-1 [Araneus ventricosus]
MAASGRSRVGGCDVTCIRSIWYELTISHLLRQGSESPQGNRLLLLPAVPRHPNQWCHQESKPSCRAVFWFIQTQEHLDHQIVENENLQALIDSQNKTIESLTNRLTVSLEDAISACSKIIRLAQTEEWEKSKYCDKYTWLREFNYKKISFSRNSEVLIFRFLSRSLPLNIVLYKCRLIDSPNCAVCQTPKTWEHFVLACPQFENARDSLRSNLGCIPLSIGLVTFLFVDG